jgi:hypothetical protein
MRLQLQQEQDITIQQKYLTQTRIYHVKQNKIVINSFAVQLVAKKAHENGPFTA